MENRRKSRPQLQAPKTPCGKSHSFFFRMRLKCNHWKKFCYNPRLQKCPQVRPMANFAKTPKSAIFWNSSNGGPRENRPKSRRNLQAPKKPWHKSHRLFINMRLNCNHRTTFCCKPRLQKVPAIPNYGKTHRLFINMRLKCNHWTTFCRKSRLQKCRQVQAMANFAKTPRSTENILTQTAGPKVAEFWQI